MYDSESLSSKDSLECKISTSGGKNVGSDSAFPLDLEKSHFASNKHNHVDQTSFYTKMILNYLPQSRLLEQQKLQELEGSQGLQHHALKSSLAVQEESAAPLNNLNKVLNSEPVKRPVVTPSLQQTAVSSLKPPEEEEEDEEEVQKAPAAVTAPHSSRKVKFLKGILKKPSKFMSEDVACSCRLGRSLFAKEVASALKDSVELTRAKMSEGGGGVKKKLRWLDEVQTERDNQEPRRQMGDVMSAGDHQPSQALVPGGPRPAQRASASYHFTKLAWADVGVQVSLQQEQPQPEVRAPRPPRREHVSLLARKGIVIRPQSTAELSQIAHKAQGRFMAPRPPPRPYAGRTPYGTDHSAINGKQAHEAVDSHRCPPAVEGGAKAEGGPCLNTTPTDEEISQLWHGVRSALSSTDGNAL